MLGDHDPMTPIALAESLARRFEGCRLKAYKNAHDVWTTGFGHTKGVVEGMTCTMAQAVQWLLEDLADAAAVVEREVRVALSVPQKGALIDFVFNLGQTKFDGSTLLRELNLNDFADVPNQLGRWVHDAAGNVLPGLVSRRKAEADLWSQAA